jgi:hypothetical protein
MEKRIEIDDNGKLVIYNDNCTRTSNETITKLNGDYLINADDIHKLMVLVENKHLLHSCQVTHYLAYTNKIQDFNLCTCDKELLDTVDKKLRKTFKEIEVLSKQKDILESLINKHNEKCGLFHKEIKLPKEYAALNSELL